MLLKSNKTIKKQSACPETEIEEIDANSYDTSTLMQILQQQEEHTLESRGILFIDEAISKQTLASATKKLLEYHFNSDFEEDVQLIINSPGGYTDAGNAFIDIMQWCRLHIRTIALGEISSMATLIFIHGDERIMAPNSIAMIHQFSSVNMGNYTDLVASRKYEDIEMKRHLRMFLECSKYQTEEQVQKHLLKSYDNYLTPTEMIEHGLCDGVFEPQKVKKNVPKKKVQRNSKRKSKP